MWHTYTGCKDIPVNTTALFEVQPAGTKTPRYEVGVVHERITIIGGRFYYDWGKIIRWRDIGELIAEK